jgi:hypothetical protein
MLVACRLAGPSALKRRYADVDSPMQSGTAVGVIFATGRLDIRSTGWRRLVSRPSDLDISGVAIGC